MTPAKWRALGSYLAGSVIRGGPGMRVRRMGNKTIVTAKRRFSSGVAENPCGAFRLERGEDPNKLVVTESTIIGQVPADFVEGKKIFTISSEAGKIYGKIIIGDDGEASAAEVLQGEDVPADTDTAYHREIGTFTVEGTGEDAVLTFTQTNCGPLDADVCRNWFASAAPFYGVSWR